jgi:hypothetical protein
MVSAESLIQAAEADLGYTEPASGVTKFGQWYEIFTNQLGQGFDRGNWCDMAIAKWAHDSGNADAVGIFAYVPFHEAWFKAQGIWHSGTDGIQRGDIAVFDWETDNLADHIGIVEGRSGAGVQTIEANTSNKVDHRTRAPALIKGYGRPRYGVSMTDTLMPDVSEFQTAASGNAPNWAGIKKQNGGAGIIRVGYGNAHLDHMFVSNYTAMKANKFSFIGLYHYVVAGQDITSQANQFCKWIGPASAVFPGTVFIIDMEEGTGNQLSRTNTWLNIVDKFYGLDKLALNLRSWVYSGQSFAVDRGLTPIFNSARHTWVASYKATEAGLLPHTLWQSTNGQVGANITNWSGAGKCDTSIAHLSVPQLAAMGWKGQVKPPVIVDPPSLTKFPPPTGLAESGRKTSIGVKWNPVTVKVNGSLPTGYTVQCLQLNGVKVGEQVVTGTSARFDLLTPGWEYNIVVWANGSPEGSPHATLRVKA